MMTPREQHADLIVLEMFDALRSSRRHDYGCGQRVAELNRRRRELERCDHDRRGAAITRAELADAFARVGRPRPRSARARRIRNRELACRYVRMADDRAPVRRARRGDVVSRFVVQVWNGRTWSKRRGLEGGPWNTRDRAERIAASLENAPRRSTSSDGRPHRVVEVTS